MTYGLRSLKQASLVAFLLFALAGCGGTKTKPPKTTGAAPAIEKNTTGEADKQTPGSDPKSNVQAPIRMEIGVHWPGAAVEEIEKAIALPLEEAVKSIEGVQSMRTRIEPSDCRLTLEFSSTNDIDRRIADIRTGLDTIRSLPESAEEITLRRLPTAKPIWIVWQTAPDTGPLSHEQAEQLRGQMIRTPFVAEVKHFGSVVSRWEVVVDSDAAKKFGTSEQAVRDAIRRFETTQSERARPTEEQLGVLAVSAKSDQPVAIRDVAQVKRTSHTPAPTVWNDHHTTAFRVTWNSISAAEQTAQQTKLFKSFPQWLDLLALKGTLVPTLADGPDLRVVLDFPDGTSPSDRTRMVERARADSKELLAECAALWLESDNKAEVFLAQVTQPDELTRQLHDKVLALPGVMVSVANLRSAPKPILLRVSGPDLDELRKWSQALRAGIGQLDGVSGVLSADGEMATELRIVPKVEKLKELGITVTDFSRRIQPLIGDFTRSQAARHRIVIRSTNSRAGLDLSKLKIAIPTGEQVPLSQVASASVQTSQATLIRVDQQRCIEIQVQTQTAAHRQTLSEKLKTLLKNTRPKGLGPAYRGE